MKEQNTSTSLCYEIAQAQQSSSASTKISTLKFHPEKNTIHVNSHKNRALCSLPSIHGSIPQIPSTLLLSPHHDRETNPPQKNHPLFSSTLTIIAAADRRAPAEAPRYRQTLPRSRRTQGQVRTALVLREESNPFKPTTQNERKQGPWLRIAGLGQSLLGYREERNLRSGFGFGPHERARRVARSRPFGSTRG